MSHRSQLPNLPASGSHDLFAMRERDEPTPVLPEYLPAYVAALEARCDMLWCYIQGHECPGDPVVELLAASLGDGDGGTDPESGFDAD